VFVMARKLLAERAAARALRARGWSLRRIAAELDVSLSSASVWVRDAPSPPAPQLDEPSEELPSECDTKRCGRCDRVLPLDQFNRLGQGRQWWCRDCFRAYFRTRGALHRRQSATAKRMRQRDARRYVRRYLECHPCTDCGEPDLIVLEFDHIAGKRNDIGILVRGGLLLPALQMEIERCEVVCSNCHRWRTARRAKWRRASADWKMRLDSLTSPVTRNLSYAYEELERRGCSDCGLRDLCVLEFDHFGEKGGSAHDRSRRLQPQAPCRRDRGVRGSMRKLPPPPERRHAVGSAGEGNQGQLDFRA
jgi:hypothetical protein